MASPNPKPGRNLDHNVIDTVQKFYTDASVSRITQTKYACSNRTAVYALFKQEHLGFKVGFSKFASLCPKHVLAGSSGTHIVCINAIHQNMKLLDVI
ncbi:hypothetical protein PR048_002148 [Dryococelus australis]|uniref:Uncharacterized protein n=1 Tax=Dryococelus australis TaxID=614101 RepID=A0ABQ9IJD0_9NEOP|nr:hypothetical protein PR048_002148 [Dryococelus australis]